MVFFQPRHLRAFLAVVHGGSVAHAGEEISRVQSAITHAVRGLETDLGVQLFERHARGMQPTEFGRMPSSQGGLGRDHNPYCFTNWLCGGGIKGGTTLREARRSVAPLT